MSKLDLLVSFLMCMTIMMVAAIFAWFEITGGVLR